MDLSITIASYNSREITRQALKSIFEHTRELDFEIIVVDNGSTDGSPEMISTDFPSVRLICSGSNLGFAAAHNMALRAARGRTLLVLNSDVEFLDNAAKKMVDRLYCGGDDVGIVGPQVLDRGRRVAPSSRRRALYPLPVVCLSLLNQHFPFKEYLPISLLQGHFGAPAGRIHDYFDPPKSVEVVEWLDGICVLFRREALVQVGLFDEQFYFDYEIGDLLWRLREGGWKIIFDPEVQIVHLGGYSRKRVSGMLVHNQRSVLTFYAKHKPGYVRCLKVWLLFLLKVKAALARNGLMRRSDQEIGRQELEILREAIRVVGGFTPESVVQNERISAFTSEQDRVAAKA